MTDWQSPTSDSDEAALPTVLGGPLPLALTGFLILVVVGGTIDLALDRPQTLLSWHVLFEGTMVLVSLSFAIVLFRGWRRTARELGQANAFLTESNKALAQRQAERDHWRKSAEDALSGFSWAIDRQFDAWQLSRAERQVALLILKGVGHKQAAAQLGRSERTVRQHAVEVYRKAGLQGRAELAAFFLHDLSLPDRTEGRKT
ncbi:MAG: helix-turn-helix transcriptional regulator [Gemmatimonadaceae bacterium]|nr:helix-turn-helix transcriptional regulator [Gemmatimonadaceae bacterium]